MKFDICAEFVEYNFRWSRERYFMLESLLVRADGFFFNFNFNFNFFLCIILTYVLTLYLLLTRCLHYINLHYLQYIYYNTITLVKLNYS